MVEGALVGSSVVGEGPWGRGWTQSTGVNKGSDRTKTLSGKDRSAGDTVQTRTGRPGCTGLETRTARPTGHRDQERGHRSGTGRRGLISQVDSGPTTVTWSGVDPNLWWYVKETRYLKISI